MLSVRRVGEGLLFRWFLGLTAFLVASGVLAGEAGAQGVPSDQARVARELRSRVEELEMRLEERAGTPRRRALAHQ